jgi:hypothetical protein
MPIATNVRAYADAALKQGKTALSQASTAVNTATDRVVELVEDAPKPAFAVLGAADLAVETVAKHLPKGATDVHLSKAKEVYGTLTARGEAKIAALRNDPRLAKLRGDVSDAAETLQAKVVPVAHTVQGKVGPVAHSVQAKVAPVIDTAKSANPLHKPAPRAAPVRKAPARKAPAKKAPGAEATPSA